MPDSGLARHGSEASARRRKRRRLTSPRIFFEPLARQLVRLRRSFKNIASA
jgi:hypothetical protein